MEIRLIGGDPVGGDVPLRRVEGQLPRTDQSVQLVFQAVFDVRVPGPRLVGLGPQVRQGMAAPRL
jgi:hypothetical protein